MKKEIRKIAIFSLAFFFLTIFIINFVAAQNPFLDPILKLFEGGLSVSSTKILFFILLSLLVWSIIETAGFVRNNGVRWLISLIVSFLGVAYLAPQDVWALLLSYNALGMTLLFLFPMLILFFFTIRVIKVGRAQGVVAQYLMWIIYFLFLLYRFYYLAVIDKKFVYGESTSIIFGAAIFVSAFMVFGNKWIRKWLGKEFVNTEIQSAEAIERRAAAVTRARSKTVQEGA